MVIAVASGKGGTGKTTVAVGLALAYRQRGRRVQLLDCDVEEPNCHLLLPARQAERAVVTVDVPQWLAEQCQPCDRCTKICAYHALGRVRDGVVVFEELCHACRACMVLCPEHALVAKPRPIGEIETTRVDGVTLVTGRLNVGEPRATPVIEAVKARAETDATVIIDAPPGTSCPVLAALKGAGAVVLVAEPTPFGLHDLRLALEGVAHLDAPIGIVVNRVGVGDGRVQRFAAERGYPVLAEIPDDPQTARGQSDGDAAAWFRGDLLAALTSLAEKLEETPQSCVS